MIAQHLKDARALVARPGGWTQGAFAKTAKGIKCDVDEEDAECFCAYGAIRKSASHDMSLRLRMKSLVLTGQDCECVDMSMAIWNDQPNRTQQEVVAAFDAAIALAEAEGL